MYKFIKTHDEKSQYDNADILVQTKYNDVTLEDLLSMFKGFLQACGYAISFHEELELVKSFEGTEEIQLDLTPQQFNAIASLAHERDITFNEMVNTILADQLSVLESKEEFDNFINELKTIDEDAEEEFNKTVEKLKEQKKINEEMIDGEQLDLFDQQPEEICAEENMKAKLVDTPELVEREVYEKQFGNPPDSVERNDDVLDQPDSVEKESRYEKTEAELEENKKHMTKTWENVAKAKEVVKSQKEIVDNPEVQEKPDVEEEQPRP